MTSDYDKPHHSLVAIFQEPRGIAIVVATVVLNILGVTAEFAAFYMSPPATGYGPPSLQSFTYTFFRMITPPYYLLGSPTMRFILAAIPVVSIVESLIIYQSFMQRWRYSAAQYSMRSLLMVVTLLCLSCYPFGVALRYYGIDSFAAILEGFCVALFIPLLFAIIYLPLEFLIRQED